MTLSDRFFADLARMGQRRQTDPAHYFVVWCSESDLTPTAVNAAGGARGLNQMTPDTLRGLGAPADFEKLAAEEQLPWIERLIAARERLNGGPFESAARYYHSNFFPLTMARGDLPSTVVVAGDDDDGRERAAYAANKGLDADGDGRITLADFAAVLERVRATRCRGAFDRLDRAIAAHARRHLGRRAAAYRPTRRRGRRRCRCGVRARRRWARTLGDPMNRVHGYSRTPGRADAEMTVGRFLPKFVVPADVRDLKNRIDPFVRAMDQSVADCKGLTDAVRTGWGGFSQAWRTYFDEEDSWMHTAAQMDQGEAYERDLARWQDWIAQFKCVTSTPQIMPSTTGDPSESKEMNALTTYSSPEHGDLAQWLEQQIRSGATRVILRQKGEETGDQLVREFARGDGADANALAGVIHQRAHEDGRHFRGRSLYGVFAYRDRDYIDRFFFAVEGLEDHAHFGQREANLRGVTQQLMRHNEANARLAIGQTLDVIGHYKALLAAREKRIEELETKYCRVVELYERLTSLQHERDLEQPYNVGRECRAAFATPFARGLCSGITGDLRARFLA